MKNIENQNKIFKVSRREFLKVGAIGMGGLLLGFPISCANEEPKFITGNPEFNFSQNVYVHLSGTGEITLIAHRSEMGTGIRTSLPLVLADEMEADWAKVKIIQATADKKYGDQNTDGSFSIRMFYPIFRKIGATVKLLLLQAAANEWKVDISECKAENHTIIHSSGKVFGYGYLAEKAQALPVPDDSKITLKSPKDFKFINKKTSIYDLTDIVTGKAKFGLDISIENAKIVVIQRNPVVGAGIKSFNSDEALQISGVRKIYEMKSPGFPTGFDKPLGGIVIIADTTWAALKAKQKLVIEWDKGINSNYDTEKFLEEKQKLVLKKGILRRNEGNTYDALKKATKIVNSTFVNPHYAHASMETPCAIADYKSDSSIEIWAPNQSPQWAKAAVAKALEIDEEKVTLNITLLGCGFGRKSKPDYIVEAALISKEIGEPVKLLWTREDDIQHDFYHFNGVQNIQVGIDADNKVNSWLHRSIFPPIGGTEKLNEKLASTGGLSQGAVDMPLDIENVTCETNEAQTLIRIGWMRAVGNVNHGFAIGSALDQVAAERNIDPIENYLELLGNDRIIDFPAKVEGIKNYNVSFEDYPWETARMRKVVETLREKSGWGKTLSKGKGMGFASHRSFLTYVACVVEVEVDEQNNIKIPMVHFCLDCGKAVNPDRIKAQFEGGAAFGAGLVLKSEITVKNGAVEQSNFDNYQVARMTDSPIATEVHIIDSEEKPTGVGEPPVPPMIAALCNAIFNATGFRITTLPFKIKDFVNKS